MYHHKTGVTLRKLNKADLSDLFKLKQESWWGTHNTLIINEEDQLIWYNSIPSNQLFLVAEKDQQAFGVAAYTNIDFINRKLHISGSIYKQYRNKFAYDGFCAGCDFAFEMLNMHRIEAEVLEYHIPAQKLELGVLGMKLEGRKRKVVYKCGRYFDSLIIGLLRQEWQNQDRVKNYGDSCNLNFSPSRFEKLCNERINLISAIGQ